MPWCVGLDEAGYGPNLGPLVVASTTCRLPEKPDQCLWKKLAKAVRKSEHKDDGRLLVDDSKKVNEGPNGLARLEAGVLAALAARNFKPRNVHEFLTDASLGNSLGDLQFEPWFDAADPLPVAHLADALSETAPRFANSCESACIEWGPIRSVVVPAPRFNRLLDEWRVKSGVVASAVIQLLHTVLDLPGDEPIHVFVDKLGGRNYYAPLLNEAFPDGWVNVVREGPERCEYTIDGFDRSITVRFEPRADGTHLNVALASMAAKYLREVFMGQFNRYWLKRVPGLEPTAGYPGDASRFFDAIRPLIAADGIEERNVWRLK
jgi:ribonuclease HII